MKRVVAFLVLFVSLVAGVQPATAATPDRAGFRYVRPLSPAPGGGPVVVEPDGALFAHAHPGFADLRIADARGREVPWRPAPVTVQTVNSDRQDRSVGARERPRLLRRRPRSVSQREVGTRTIVTLDFGFRDVPVDEIRIAAGTGRYERPISISGSNGGRRFLPLGSARIFRFPGSSSAPIPIRARRRYLRIEIENGDDPPLRGIDVEAWSHSRALLVEGGHPTPYTAYYGNPRADAPSYDFARLPAVGGEHPLPGRLGRERQNLGFEPPPDTRTFAVRNPGVVTAALALAALAVGAVGLLVLRKRP